MPQRGRGAEDVAETRTRNHTNQHTLSCRGSVLHARDGFTQGLAARTRQSRVQLDKLVLVCRLILVILVVRVIINHLATNSLGPRDNRRARDVCRLHVLTETVSHTHEAIAPQPQPNDAINDVHDTLGAGKQVVRITAATLLKMLRAGFRQLIFI